MAKTDRVRKQHVVSKFYLKGFADHANQLRRMLLPGDHSHLISADKATVITDFYSITLDDGEVTDFFEREFSKIESPAADVHRRIITQGVWPLAAEDKQYLSLWIALQYLRSEGVRTQETEAEALMIRIIVGVSGKAALRRHIEVAEGQPISQERLDFEWNELTRAGGPRLRPDPSEHLRMVADLLVPTAAMFASKQWSLNEFQLKSLVTGDHPVSLVRAPDHPAHMGLSLVTAGSVALPLSRKYAISIGAAPGLPDLRVSGTAKLAHVINQQTVLNSRKCLYFHPDDYELIENLHVPGPKTNEMDLSGGDRFIKEDGFFGELSDQELIGLRPAILSKNGDGVTLGDLKWPIDRRLVVWETEQN